MSAKDENAGTKRAWRGGDPIPPCWREPDGTQNAFHVRIDGGLEQTVIVRTGVYMHAAVAACVILGAIPCGQQRIHVEIWLPGLLLEYGPYHYLVEVDECDNIVARHAVPVDRKTGVE